MGFFSSTVLALVSHVHSGVEVCSKTGLYHVSTAFQPVSSRFGGIWGREHGKSLTHRASRSNVHVGLRYAQTGCPTMFRGFPSPLLRNVAFIFENTWPITDPPRELSGSVFIRVMRYDQECGCIRFQRFCNQLLQDLAVSQVVSMGNHSRTRLAIRSHVHYGVRVCSNGLPNHVSGLSKFGSFEIWPSFWKNTVGNHSRHGLAILSHVHSGAEV